MSHFTVLVVGQDPKFQLAPFHEFECTGEDNEFVQDVDRTEEAQKAFAEAKETRLRAPDGSLHSFFDEKGDWRPEFSKPAETAMAWDKRRERFVPEGYAETEVLTATVESFAEWAEGYYGAKPVLHGSRPDLSSEHKYGYLLLDQVGEVVKLIDRTNPNSKWDWWQVGGRYSKRLLLKNGARVDSARKGDVDWPTMERDSATNANHEWVAVRAILSQHPAVTPWADVRDKYPDDIERARKEYDEQPGARAFREFNEANDYKYGFMEGPDRYICEQKEYVQRAVDGAYTMFAFVKDRKWQERGEMGWWAHVSNEKDPNAWNSTFREFLQSLGDDELLTVVDCHI